MRRKYPCLYPRKNAFTTTWRHYTVLVLSLLSARYTNNIFRKSRKRATLYNLCDLFLFCCIIIIIDDVRHHMSGLIYLKKGNIVTDNSLHVQVGQIFRVVGGISDGTDNGAK